MGTRLRRRRAHRTGVRDPELSIATTIVHALSDRDMLALWEAADGEPPVRRGLALLATAGGADDCDVERLTLGEWHARLLQLRAATFGPNLTATSPCPDCDTAVEFTVNIGQLIATAPATTRPATTGVAAHASNEHAGYRFTQRPLTVADVLSALAAATADELETGLLAASVGDVLDEGGATVPVTALPIDVRRAVADRASALDPLAELRFELTCPDCAAAFSSDLDVVEFVWAEVVAAAQRALLDVDALASAYGWSEPDVLALSPQRRAAYLHFLADAPA